MSIFAKYWKLPTGLNRTKRMNLENLANFPDDRIPVVFNDPESCWEPNLKWVKLLDEDGQELELALNQLEDWIWSAMEEKELNVRYGESLLSTDSERTEWRDQRWKLCNLIILWCDSKAHVDPAVLSAFNQEASTSLQIAGEPEQIEYIAGLCDQALACSRLIERLHALNSLRLEEQGHSRRELKLSNGQQEIVNVVNDAKTGIRQTAIINELSKRGKNPSDGTVKMYCAMLVRMGAIRRNQDGYIPK
ncbi:hypothetical protein [Symmachiella dynata]|uniref:hypothetical protein n=1 Tax=Symmachiella dynata TaxID=2527995 RepID=UPI0030EB93C9